MPEPSDCPHALLGQILGKAIGFPLLDWTFISSRKIKPVILIRSKRESRWGPLTSLEFHRFSLPRSTMCLMGWVVGTSLRWKFFFGISFSYVCLNIGYPKLAGQPKFSSLRLRRETSCATHGWPEGPFAEHALVRCNFVTVRRNWRFNGHVPKMGWRSFGSLQQLASKFNANRQVWSI